MNRSKITGAPLIITLSAVFLFVPSTSVSSEKPIITGNLRPEFTDRFDGRSCELNTFEPKWWAHPEGEAKCESGYAVLRAINTYFVGPGVGPVPAATAAMTTRRRYLSTGLRGTNLVETDFLGYASNGGYVNAWLDTYKRVSGAEGPDGKYEMGWSIQIGSRQPGSKAATNVERWVKVQFDWWTGRGLVVLLERNSLPGDQTLYTKSDMVTIRNETSKVPFLDEDLVVLKARMLKREEFAPAGHKYGLGCADNGATLFWTLDGRVMDAADIRGFFDSVSSEFRDGAYVGLIGTSSYQDTLWRFDNVTFSR
jgi:hypothetical protein